MARDPSKKPNKKAVVIAKKDRSPYDPENIRLSKKDYVEKKRRRLERKAKTEAYDKELKEEQNIDKRSAPHLEKKEVKETKKDKK